MPYFVVGRLRNHLASQDAERPIVAIGDSVVFVTEAGLAVNGSWFTKHFQSLLLRAGLPTTRLHDLRHGASSLLEDAGAHPQVATELLRHHASANRGRIRDIEVDRFRITLEWAGPSRRKNHVRRRNSSVESVPFEGYLPEWSGRED